MHNFTGYHKICNVLETDAEFEVQARCLGYISLIYGIFRAMSLLVIREEGRKRLFKYELNTFYLRLNGIS